MRLLLGDIGPAALWIATLLPMAALPWWSESLPRGLRAINAEFAGVIGDMLDSLDPLGRLIASEPAEATLANGARLAWPAGQGLYAETFGKLRFEAPNPPPRSADEALVALAESTRLQVHAMGAVDRAALFSRLSMDKARELPHAEPGLPAGGEADTARCAGRRNRAYQCARVSFVLGHPTGAGALSARRRLSPNACNSFAS